MKYLKNQPGKINSVILLAVLAFFTIISCSPAKQDSKQTQPAPVLPPTQEQPFQTETTQPVEVETTEQPAETSNSTEVMLNPPHGEPFHRCDIPVGAPLNSAPANTARQTTSNTVTTTTPQVTTSTSGIANNPMAPTLENANRLSSGQTRTTTQTTTNNTGPKPRLNPAHGQPWHRCDIPVGSPLP